MATADLTAERLRELLDYDPLTGLFTRRSKTNTNQVIGEVAGSMHHNGYIAIKVFNRTYQAHRLAWLYVYGEWPKLLIDHINRTPSDNRIENLREASRSLNMWNQSKRRSTTGLLGVTPNGKGFKASIKTGATKRIHLGTYQTAEEAHAAYLAAKEVHHPGALIYKDRTPAS